MNLCIARKKQTHINNMCTRPGRSPQWAPSGSMAFG